MTIDETIEHLKAVLKTCDVQDEEAVEMAIEALNCSEIPNNSDTISRQAAIDAVEKNACNTQRIMDAVNNLPSVQPGASKYEYHYDHTDCIWYGDGSNKCPSTCSQYRDGWNDAMQYIFGNGKGYKPYRRDGHHE